MISSENLKKEESAGTLQHKSPEYKGSIGVQAWLKIREDWLKVKLMMILHDIFRKIT